MLAKVKLEDVDGKHHFATMFSKVILAIIDEEEGNVCTKLLQSPQMMSTLNIRDVITRAVKKDSREETEKNSKDQEDIIVDGDNQAKTWREDPVLDYTEHFKPGLIHTFDIHHYHSILPSLFDVQQLPVAVLFHYKLAL